jgi:DNA-binding LacI/PurR family transcriptional regulator
MSTAKPAPAKKTPVASGITLIKGQTGPVYEQIKDRIRKKISSGAWEPGYRLPTLRELSVELDVAYATVERAMRDLTREGVLEGRKRGGTRVALMRRKPVGAIGVLGYTEYGRLLTQSRYYSTVLLLLQEKIVDQGRMAVYDSLPEGKPMIGAFNGLTHVDALVLFDPFGLRAQEVQATLELGVPVVCVGETADEGVPSVATASLRDTYEAIKHLIAMGHEHIACPFLPDRFQSPALTFRIEGFKRAMQEKSPSGFAQGQIVIGDAAQQARALLEMKPAPTALFITQSRHFPELFALLKGTHLEPGQHTFIGAYDENLYGTIKPLGIDFLSIEQRMDSMTSKTVETLLRMIQEPGFKPGHIQIPAHVFFVDKRGDRKRIEFVEER